MRSWPYEAFTEGTHHTVDYDRFIKSQVAPRNDFQGLACCKFGHFTVQISTQPATRSPPCGTVDMLGSIRTAFLFHLLLERGRDMGQGSRATFVLKTTLTGCDAPCRWLLPTACPHDPSNQLSSRSGMIAPWYRSVEEMDSRIFCGGLAR